MHCAAPTTLAHHGNVCEALARCPVPKPISLLDCRAPQTVPDPAAHHGNVGEALPRDLALQLTHHLQVAAGVGGKGAGGGWVVDVGKADRRAPHAPW